MFLSKALQKNNFSHLKIAQSRIVGSSFISHRMISQQWRDFEKLEHHGKLFLKKLPEKTVKVEHNSSADKLINSTTLRKSLSQKPFRYINSGKRTNYMKTL